VLDDPQKNSVFRDQLLPQAHRELLVVSSSETEITREGNTHVMALQTQRRKIENGRPDWAEQGMESERTREAQECGEQGRVLYKTVVFYGVRRKKNK
jgi:hypothetical protein